MSPSRVQAHLVVAFLGYCRWVYSASFAPSAPAISQPVQE
jgi:hypothetical protein